MSALPPKVDIKLVRVTFGLAIFAAIRRRLVPFHCCLFLAVAGGAGRIFPQGSVFPASGSSLSFDRYSRSMALSYSFCSLLREGWSFLIFRPGRKGVEP